MATCYICVTCGTQYPESDAPPAHCPICEDDRQYIGWQGQLWTTIDELGKDHHNTIQEEEPGLTYIRTEPTVAIGQAARVVQTRSGNILWECISFVDDATIEAVKALGGIQAIAISHPHFYSSMVQWSRALGDVPIYLHEANEPFVMRPDPAIHYWSGNTFRLNDSLTIIRCGGHFPGSSVLHWPDGAGGKGALLTGDTINVVSDRRYVSFMYSYPNQIPLNARAVTGIVNAVEPFEYDRIYSSWPEHVVYEGGKEAVARSSNRYLRAISEGMDS